MIAVNTKQPNISHKTQGRFLLQGRFCTGEQMCPGGHSCRCSSVQADTIAYKKPSRGHYYICNIASGLYSYNGKPAKNCKTIADAAAFRPTSCICKTVPWTLLHNMQYRLWSLLLQRETSQNLQNIVHES